jgi:heme O synthase-like polyprenyltransferase
VLPVVDTTGGHGVDDGRCGRGAAPATILPACAATQLGAPLHAATARFRRVTVRLLMDKTRDRARQLFFGSIIHLPVLLTVMMGEALLRGLF